MSLDQPAAWEQIVEAVSAEPGKVLVVGQASSGKTTLVRYLADRMRPGNHRVAVINADIGQAALGPPATLSGTVLRSPLRSIEQIFPERMVFVGATSPTGRIFEVLFGCQKLIQWATESGSVIILLDTTGLIGGHEGWRLKFHKIDLFRPRHLIFLQRNRELDPLMHAFSERKDIRIYNLPCSPLARDRSPAERRAYRQRRLRGYFKDASLQIFSTSQFKFQSAGGGRNLQPWMDLSKYRLVGLNDRENWTLALGIVESFDRDTRKLFIYTPLQDPLALRTVLWSPLRIARNGRELEGSPARSE